MAGLSRTALGSQMRVGSDRRGDFLPLVDPDREEPCCRSLPARVMDIAVSSAYVCGMFARLVSMLAVLAITVVTAVTSGHAARMSIEPDHAAHVGGMMHAPENTEASCDCEPHCGSTKTEMCEFVCAGLSAFLTLPNAEAGPDYQPASHELPSVATLASMAPGLNERPPKSRLL